MSNLKRLLLALLAAFALLQSSTGQCQVTNSALILYDSSGQFGWLGGLYARMLANLLGHFDLAYQISPVENYQAGQMNAFSATFYFGSVYENVLPAAFKSEALTTTNNLCWFKYNIWQIAGPAFNARTGFQFNWLDWSGFSNIVYKGETFLKNQLDPELGYITVIDTNLATVVAAANKADNSSIPYATRAGKFWYFADIPFDYISEEDRYLVFCDLLHDILGINHPASHSALIRIEDVAPTVYAPDVLRQTADVLRSQNVPFGVAIVPWYRDPLGFYNGGVPEEHHMSNTNDAGSVAFVDAIRYMLTNRGQLILHGYSHQYNAVANPYNGVSGDDFEFWRETFVTNQPNVIDIYAPIAEDSVSYVMGRIKSAKAELAAMGMKEVAWEFPHYAGSALDSRTVATNFPLVMNRVLYFDESNHVAGQYFPYPIKKDIYGQRLVPENIGNYEPVPFGAYPARSVEDLLRAAKKNLVIRDGWAAGYFHPFFDLTNLNAMVAGIRALGYTYVPISFDPPVINVQPKSQTVPPGTNVILTVGVTGATPMSFRWQLEGKNLGGGAVQTFVIQNVQPYDSGNYRVVVSNAYGVVTSEVAVITIAAPPVFSTQPKSATNAVGTSRTLSWWADGAAPITYQVNFKGNTIATTTNSWYDIVNIITNNAGSYNIVAANAFGSSTSATATLTVVTNPVIITQPQSRTNAVGTSATFSVVASGSPPLTYRWQFNNSNISGATNSTYAIPSVKKSNAGNYRVVVTSMGIASTTSAQAKLTVK